MFAILTFRTMNSKFLLLCRNKKIMIFLFFLILQCQETLSSSKTVSISRGEQIEFNLIKSHSKLKLKYEGVDSVYDIDDSYSFLTPNVTIQCHCKCTENKDKWDEFPNNNYKCPLLENSISTCTVYNTIGEGSVDCATYYKLCCQVYFSKIGVQEMYSAFHLIKHKSVYKLTLTSDIFHDRRKPINLNVHSDVKRIFVNPNLIIELKNNDNLNLISEGWYYVRENSTQIFSTSNINEKDFANLNKIGWLQSKDNVLLRIPKDELNTKLEVKVKNCLSDPPGFDWKLNAIHYARENNVLNIPPDSSIISSLYENTIRGYSINLKSKKIIMESSNPPDIKISIFPVNKSDLNISLYYCTIFIFKQRKPKLKLEILNGNGVFHVKLLSSLFTKQIYFYTEDINSAKDNRIIQIKELPVYDYTDTWVCVYQEEKQLCTLPRILEADEQILNESPIQSREDSRELNFPISDQPDVPKSISTQTFSEVNTLETEFNFSTIIVLVVMIVMFPVIGTFAWNKFKRKHRKPYIDKHKESIDNIMVEETKHLINTAGVENDNLEKTSNEEMHKIENNEKDKDISQNVARCPVLFQEIANEMKLEDWSPFGNQIGLTNLDLHNLVLEGDFKQWTFTKRCNEMLIKFSQKFPRKVNREFLLQSLEESRARAKLESDYDHQIFHEISENIQQDQWQLFGIALGFTANDLLKLQKQDKDKDTELELTVFSMLEKWKQKYNPSKNEFITKLVKALHEIERMDIANRIPVVTRCPVLFQEIVNEMKLGDWSPFGNQIGLTNLDLYNLVLEGDIKQWTFTKRCNEMLIKFSQKFPRKVNREFLLLSLEESRAWAKLESEYDHQIFHEISENIQQDQWQLLGIALGFTANDFLKLQKQNKDKDTELELTVFSMLEKWKQKYNPTKKEFITKLVKALHEIERMDIANRIHEIAIISGEISNNGVKDPLTILQEKLKKYYKTLDPPYFPWMGDFHLKYEDFAFQLNRVNESDKKPETIPLYEIFSEETDKILIEGDEGLGKTSLCFKLASDWVNSKPHVTHFQLVFVINIKELQVSIEEYIQRKMIKEANIKLSGIIETYGEKTLFVLDGFNDELTNKQKKLVVELLTGKTFAKVKIILTSDTRLFERQISSKYSTPDIDLNVFNERFQIVEQTQDYYETILFNLLIKNNWEHRIRSRNLKRSLSDEDVKHPLFLLLFDIVNSEEDVSRFISNRSQLYSKFCNFLINAECKMSTETMLKNNSSIGKMALIGLEQNRKYFTKKELEETKNDIWRGIFYADYPSGESQSTKYQSIHPHFMDYFCACYLWSIRNTVVFDRFIRYKGILNGRKVLFSFLCGLFEDQDKTKIIYLLINHLKYLAFYYSLDLNILYGEIEQFKMTEESMEALESFIPVYLEIVESHHNSGFSSSQLLSDLLQTGASKEYIKVIRWNPGYPFNLSQKIKLETLELRVDRWIPQQSLDLCKSIQCEKMNLSLWCEDENLLRNWFYLMKMIEHLNPQWMSFEIVNSPDKSCSFILEEIRSGELKERKLKNVFLQCFIQNKDAFHSLVEIIQEKDVESVYIRIEEEPYHSLISLSDANKCICQTNIDDLIISVSKNKGINEFIFHNYSDSSFNVDFYSITDKGKKHFELLWFLGNQLIFDEKEKVEFQVDALMADITLTDVETLKRIFCLTNSSMIRSDLKLIHSISEETKKFDRTKVKELDVYFDQTIFQRNRLLCLKEFTNLQMLCLEMMKLTNESMQSVGEDIVHVIQSLPCLVSFEMSFIESNIPLVSVVTEKLMKCLSTESTTDGKMFSLKIFRLEINIPLIEESQLDATLRDLTELLKLMVEPLKRRRLQEFCLLFHDLLEQRTDFPLSLAEIYPIREGFNIQWDLDGRRNGSTRNKILYKHLISIYRFSVTLLK